MAAKNAKPAKSSESGTEWTFIDTYDGTIETRKDCVTYRKPTYSEILKGVTEEELAEVESEPEFEVLASFQFRSKGESFGIGSSAPKLQESSEQLGKASKSESKDDKSDGCSSSDDSIMIISSHYKPEKPVCSEENKNNVSSETVANSDECDDECDDDDDDDGLTIKAAKAKSESSGTDDAIVVVDEGCMYDDELDDDDDDEMIDLGDSEVKDEWTKADDVDDANDCSTGSSKADDVQCTPFMDTSLNRIFLDESVDDTAEPDVKPADSTSNDKRLLSIDPLDSSKELAWDSLTFDLMDALPIMMVSTTSVDDSQSIVFQGQDSDASDCELSSDNSFVPISKSDSQDDTSSFDRLSEFSDDCSDFDEMSPMIPEWFLDPNFTIIGLDDSGHDNSYKDLEIDNEDICDPLIPTWFYDPEHNICDLDETFDESDWSDCSDSDSEYMDDSDDADSVVAIPEWLFGDKDNNREHKDNEDSFLFSHLFVDVPTFIILLFLTTALGFSIGHVGPTVVSIVGPPKAVRRQLKFGLIKIKSKPRLKGETARRRREEIRNDRLKKRETRRKALEVAVQVRELKNVLAELRSDRRKAEKEKFQLEASWRKLRRQRKQFEKEKMQHYQSDKKKIKTIKSKLKKTKSRLKTWKNVASQFQKKAANLQRDMKQISRSKERARDIKNIKMDLKIEKRKLRQQRKDLKALKTRLRQEHRNYAREGWKLEKKRKQLEKMQVPQHYSKMSANKCPKQTKQERKTSRLHVIRKARKTRQTSKRKTNRSNKKERWKLKQLKYWETLENTLKEWTQNLNKTVREKAGGKIKKVWKKLQEKFGNLINFGWTKRKKTKPPYQAKKSKKRKKESKSRAALVYEKILSEQLKFDKQKRMKMDDSRKRMKSPIIDTRKKKKEQIKTNPQTVVKQRRRRQRRKYQRELERLQQWALQMNEKKLEHERIYKEDKKKKKTKFAKVWLKTKPDERENVASEENLHSSRELEPDSVEDTSNLTNTLMLLAQPQFSDYPYESPGEEDDDSKERLENAERVVRDITMAQLEHENKKQASTGLSIPLDDEVVLLSTKNTHSEHQSSDQEKDEQMSNKPTPPLLDSTLYNKFPLLGVIESQKGGPMGLSIPPPSLDPLGSQNSVDDPIGQRTKLWYMRQTPQSWIPPPGPLQSDGSWFFQRSADRAEQRLLHGPLNKENANEQNSFRTQFLNSNRKFDKKNGIWVFARASDRAEQRLLYEPQNQQSAKDRLDSQSKKTHTNPRRPKMKNKDGTWVFERANDRAEQRLNHDPWYMRRAEGREEDREQQQDSWFIERGFDRELLREENAYDDDDDHYYDDDDDEDDYAKCAREMRIRYVGLPVLSNVICCMGLEWLGCLWSIWLRSGYDPRCNHKLRSSSTNDTKDDENVENLTGNLSKLELKHGELVHDNLFGLFEAMSAIEIMDPKMDAGMLCNKTRKVVQFKPAVDAGMIKIKDLTSEELLGIMDELLACLVTWLDGHSLVQTVFICLYMHDPFLIEDPCLKAFCIAVLKCCEFIRIAVNTAQVFEEEDFQSMTYGFKMGSPVSETRAAGMLKEAEEEIARKIKSARTSLKSDTNTTDLQCNGVTTAKQLLKTALTLVDPIKKTIELGVDGNLEKGEMLGFEPLVNQRLLPPSFPRYVSVFGRQESIDYLQVVVKRLIHVCGVVEYSPLHIIIDFVSEFSKTQPCVLTRSTLQLIAWQNNKFFGKVSGSDVVRDAIKAFNSPPSIAEKSSLSNNPKAKELSETFINRAVRSMNSVIHTLGHNRARQRDKLGQLLEEFATLQDEADKADSELHAILTKYEPQRQHFACFGSWVLYHTLNIMIQYLTSGFELELYSPYEYHYIYWYLDFLFGWHMTCLNRAEKLLQAQEIALEQKSGRSGKKNKRKKKASEKTIQEHQGMRHLYQGMRYLCQGYLRSLEGFEIDGKLKRPSFEFGSEQIRFERRFLPFQAVDTPQPMYYGHYKEFTDMSKNQDAKAHELFVLSANSFHQAKQIFELVSNLHE
ncbi:hypothetical protein QZH41_012670, partial [Actinostola sp. cb2023]